jgi:signal transduction histidine kinase
MSRSPIPVRAFLVSALVALTLLPILSGTAAWQVERQRQDADIGHRVAGATAYLTTHRNGVLRAAVIRGFARRLGQLHLLAQVTLIDKPIGKLALYASPGLMPTSVRDAAARKGLLAKLGDSLDGKIQLPGSASTDSTIPLGPADPSGALVATIYYHKPDLVTRALVGLATGVLVLLAGLVVTFWLAGRWIVTPLSRLNVQADQIAGGDLDVSPPRTRIGEVANVAAAIDGMAAALGERGQRQDEADEARRFFVAAAAHDLRTPLFALRGHLEAITTGLGDPEEHLLRVGGNAAALERLIASLFTYARHDYARQEPLLEVAALGDVVRGVVAGFEPEDAFRLVGDDTTHVVVDRDRLERVLANVLDNALRYGPAGGPVELTWIEHESTVVVRVADRGPGLAAGLLPRIFDPMVRGDSARNAATAGAGLGLTIARRLAESQGGALAAANRPGGGAEFTLTLVRAPHAAPIEARPADEIGVRRS